MSTNSEMSVAYQEAINHGVQAMDNWMSENQITTLPDSVWDLPKTCPLWGMGLSYAQAGVIHAAAKRKVREQASADTQR